MATRDEFLDRDDRALEEKDELTVRIKDLAVGSQLFWELKSNGIPLTNVHNRANDKKKVKQERLNTFLCLF